MAYKLKIAILIIISLTYVLGFNYLKVDPDSEINSDPLKPTLEGPLKKDLNYAEQVKKDGILTACLVLTRNNIVGNNLNVTNFIKNTKFDKSKVLDKILVSMIKNCQKSLNEKDVDEILSTSNILSLGSQYEKILTRIPVDIEKAPEFDNEEMKLLEIIYNIRNESEIKSNNQKILEEKLTIEQDFVTTVMAELGKTQTRYFFVGMLISFFISFIFYFLLNIIKGKKKVEETKSQTPTNPKKKKN